jgi:hypothetical protein
VALEKNGLSDQARDVVALLKQTAESRYVPPFNIALACNGLGNQEQAFSYLKIAAEQRDVRLIFLPVDPNWQEMNQNPGVRALWPAPQKHLATNQD